MANILLPIQWDSLPQGYCFTTWDQLGLDISNAQKAVLANGRSFYNIGDTKPAPEFQIYPWFNTSQGRWYVFNGVWRSPNNLNANERRLFTGTLTDLLTYDGGSAGTVTPTSGPTWVEDENFRGRSPMGPGAIPTTDPVKTLSVVEDYGEGEHTLTQAEGGVGTHTHAFGQTNATSDDAYFSNPGLNTVATYQGFYITGSNGRILTDQTTADLFTLPSGSDGAGLPTPDGFNIVHPVRGCYVIKPSGRTFYVIT